MLMDTQENSVDLSTNISDIKTPQVSPTTWSSKQNDKTLHPMKRPFLTLLKNSLQRTFSFFSGNEHVDFTQICAVPGAMEKRIRVLSNEEFIHPDQNQSGVKASTAVSATPLNETLQPQQLNATPSYHNTALVSPHPVQPSSHLPLGVPSSQRVDPLQHLVIRRPLKIPKAAKHHQWELMRVISGHQGWVRALSVDPKNEWFVSGGNDRLIKVWDLASGTLKLSLTGHINTIRALHVSNRHPYLFSAGEDQMVKCWDLEYNKVVRHYHGHLSGIYCMALHPSLDILATGGRDAVVRVWDIRTKVAVHVLSGHTGTVMSLASQKAEPQLISSSLDKMIRCWDLVSGRSSVVLTHHKKSVRGFAIHPREYTFCSAAADHVKVWKCPKGDFERNLEPVGTILNGITVRDDGDSGIAIAGSDQGQLYFWDWDSGQKFQTIETIPQPGSLSGEKAIYAVQFDMSQTRLLTGECDKTIKVWREKVNEAL